MKQLLFIILIIFEIKIYAQDGRPTSTSGFNSLMGGMSLGASTTTSVVYGGASTLGAGESAVSQQRLNVIQPVYKDANDSYSASVSTSMLHFNENLTFLGSQTAIPRDFYKVELGSQYSRQLAGGQSLGARVSVGSASDEIFTSSKDLTFTAGANYSFASEDSSYWVLTLYMSNNSPIINYVPIPGFIYFYKNSNFMGMFGFPISAIQWKFVNPWALSVSIFGLSLNSELIYGERESAQFLVGYNWGHQSYLRHNREKNEDRIYYEEMKVFSGARLPLYIKTFGELQIGYSYNRRVYEGPDFREQDRGSKDLANSWYAQWNIRAIF